MWFAKVLSWSRGASKSGTRGRPMGARTRGSSLASHGRIENRQGLQGIPWQCASLRDAASVPLNIV
jgi:hypothetical protein